MPTERSLRTATPNLAADVRLLSTTEGGKTLAIRLGFACLCALSDSRPPSGFHGYPLLLDGPLAPGGAKRLGFVIINPEGAEALKRQGHFYLFEGERLFGTAVVV